MDREYALEWDLDCLLSSLYVIKIDQKRFSKKAPNGRFEGHLGQLLDQFGVDFQSGFVRFLTVGNPTFRGVLGHGRFGRLNKKYN